MVYEDYEEEYLDSFEKGSREFLKPWDGLRFDEERERYYTFSEYVLVHAKHRCRCCYNEDREK